MNPPVLVAATSHWFPTARLAMALAGAGCVVDAVCPPRHPLCNVEPVRQIYKYKGLAPISSLTTAIVSSGPELIVSCDDLMTHHLHDLYRRQEKRGLAGAAIRACVERSFGSAESFPILYQRAAFMRLAREEGVRAPQTEVISSLEQLRKWANQNGFPIVLKVDGTSGGNGVRIVHTLEAAQKAFAKLQAPPLIARAAKRALVDRDRTLVWPSLLQRRSIVNAQRFVDGREATSMVACWQGKVLAGLYFEVIHKTSTCGHATVIRLIENSEMRDTVEKIVRRLNLSGMHGFDFILEDDSGHSYLIEINPRATQVGHLTLGAGRDLPGTLAAVLSGTAVRPAPKITENDVITLFPQEWARDASSPLIRSGYHDVPWEEPKLVQACIRKALKLSPTKIWARQQPATTTVRLSSQPVLIKQESRNE